jgi:hypothetical protein
MKRDKTAKEKELADNERLLRQWRKWHHERLAEILAGPHAVIATQVVTFLRIIELTPSTANALLELMRGQCWADVEADTRFELLHLINSTITDMRTKSSMPAIDDPLPDQPANAFLLIKQILFP